MAVVPAAAAVASETEIVLRMEARRGGREEGLVRGPRVAGAVQLEILIILILLIQTTIFEV